MKSLYNYYRYVWDIIDHLLDDQMHAWFRAQITGDFSVLNIL